MGNTGGVNTGGVAVPVGSTRLATQKSIDPRAARTRQVILDAVAQMVAECRAPETVNDIVRRAGISRSSFYAHFADLDELAVSFLQQEFIDIGYSGVALRTEDCITGAQVARMGYRRLVAHLVDNYPLYTTVLGLPLTRRAYDEAVSTYASELIGTILVAPAPDDVVPEIVTTYIAGGVLTLISAWMRGDISVSDDELVDQLVGLLPPWLTQ